MDVYKQFDKESIAPSEGSTFSFRFKTHKRELVLGIVAIVMILVIIILAALLASSKTQDGGSITALSATTCQNSCFSPSCLQTAAHVLELANASAANYCEDFYTFACSNFPNMHPLKPDEGETSTYLLMYNDNLEKIRRMIDTPPASSNPYNFEYKAKTFYASCQDHFLRMQRQGTPFLEQVVAPSGGWWALQGDATWSKATYNFQDQLEKVHVDFWSSAFFKFHIGYDRLDWNKATIEIDIARIGLPHYFMPFQIFFVPRLQKELNAYTKYMRTIGGLLLRDANLNVSETERQYRLDTFVQDALYVETEMAKLKRDVLPQANPHAQDSRVKLSELNAVSGGAVDWIKLLQYMFNTSPVNADTYVVVYEYEFVEQFAAWINNLPSANKTRILNNYMIWRLAIVYEEDLSWDYLQAQQEIRYVMSGEKEHQPTWKYCLTVMNGYMSEALSAIYVRDHFSDENRIAAIAITDYVKKALVSALTDNFSWMSPSTRKIAIKKIVKSLIKLGYPDYMMNENTLNQIYSSLTITKDDYFGNLLAYNKLFQKQWNTYLSHPNDRLVWAYNTYAMLAEYYNPWKELIIPAGMLRFPIYDHTSPGYTNYGSLGSIIAIQLTSAVDDIGNSYMLNGSQYGSWWSVNSTNEYMKVRECFMDAYQNLSMGPFNYPDYETETVPVDLDYFAPVALSEATGVKLAYKAYQQWVGVTGGEKGMPGAAYTNNQMFFISYAQSHCASRTLFEEMNLAFSAYDVPEKIRINAALSQLKEFQDTFGCTSGSKMVAPTQCSLY